MSQKTQKIVAAVAATVLAVSIMLGGTLAWQSINQEATNIVSETINPGGRLHDDFDGTSKDIYIENFADIPIYARIQLREYLELGSNLPGSGTQFIPAGAETFHDATVDGNVDKWAIHYYDETQNETDNYVDFFWGGSKTYMPTFNMNKDSLEADINGTYEGLIADNASTADNDEADRYSDHIDYSDPQYAAGSTGLAGTEIRDIDTNDIDEYKDQSGFVGTNWTETPETHYASETRNATVISMAEWKAMDPADQAVFYGWVYDVDGWAYWSQPIEPKEVNSDGVVTSQNTTGLLLNTIIPHIDNDFYYQIHVIAQFITANDLGNSDGTGFFAAGKGTEPTADALALLNSIGVDITGGSTLTLQAANNETTVAPGGSVTFSVAETVSSVNWLVNGSNVVSAFSTDAIVEATTIDENGTLTVATNEAAPKLTVIAIAESETTDDDGNVTATDTLVGYFEITVVQPPDVYAVTVSAANDAETVRAGDTLQFSALVTKNEEEDTTSGVTWTMEGGSADTSIDATTGLLTVADTEADGTELIITATSQADRTVSDTYTITVQSEYAVEVTAEGDVLALKAGSELQFGATVTKNDKSNTDGVDWMVADADGNEVDGASIDTDGVLLVDASVPEGTALVITATSKAYPTVSGVYELDITEGIPEYVKTIGGITPGSTDIVTIDGIDFYVLAKDTDNHRALLLSKDVLEQRAFDAGDNDAWFWDGSDLRTYLNGDWLSDKPTLKKHAINTTISSLADASGASTTAESKDQVFLLSWSDVWSGDFGENTYGAQLTAPGGSWIANHQGAASAWWIRTYASGWYAVNTDGEYLQVSDGTTALGVRPALWVALEDAYSIELSAAYNSDTVAAGGTLPFKATVLRNNTDDTTIALTWSVTEMDGVSLSSDGLLTVDSDVPAGTKITVKVASRLDRSLSDSYEVTVIAADAHVKGLETITAGSTDTVTIDNIDFYVLAKDTTYNRVLLLSKEIFEQRVFDAANDNYWDGSDLQTYLNGAWFDDKPTLEKYAIESTVRSYAGSGSADSTDQVFLLSYSDMFDASNGSDEWTYTSQLPAPGGSWIANYNGAPSEWWVRSSSSNPIISWGVGVDGAFYNNMYVTESYGVRPAMWIRIEDAYTVDVSAAYNSDTVAAGGTLQFSAATTKNGVEDTTTGVTWTVTEMNGVTIEQNGLLKVDASVGAGAKLTVTATSKGDGMISDSYEVTILGADAYKDEIANITAGSAETVTIDNIDFYVLVKDTVYNRVLLLSKEIFEQRVFDADGANYWDGSDLQTYLNGEWLDDKPTLKQYAIDETISSYAGSAAAESQDQVFVLSYSDVAGGSFGENTYGSQIAAPGGSWAVNYNGAETGWWLRTAFDSKAYVAWGDASGTPFEASVVESYGVRPAMWIRFEDAYTVDVSAAYNSDTVEAGETLQFSVATTKNGVEDTTTGVIWSVTGDNGATISSEGLLQVDASVDADTMLVVTATSKGDNKTADSYTVMTLGADAYKDDISKITAGSAQTVTIDNIDFYVLAKDTTYNRVLLMSKEIFEQRVFDADVNNYWDGSDLQTYLNGEWLDDKPTLKQYAIDETISSYSGSAAAESTDQVFLLSWSDVYGASNDLFDWTHTAQLTAPGGSWIVNYNDAPIGWWLRSTGNGISWGVDTNGQYSNSGFALNASYGVRPAMWVRFEDVYSLELTTTRSTIFADRTMQLDATLLKNGVEDDSGIEWSVNGVTGVSINASGLLTVGNVQVGTEIIVTATSTADRTAYDTHTITVVETSIYKEEIAKITEGSTDTVNIDGIDFYVLAKDTTNKQALLLSKDILEQRAYDEAKDDYWDGSDLQLYLNGDWLSDKPTLAENAISTKIGTYNENAASESEDQVFLLSYSDVWSGDFGENTYGSQLTAPGGSWIANYQGTASAWWVRTYASGWWAVNTDGNYVSGLDSTAAYGVRPALWIDISE